MDINDARKYLYEQHFDLLILDIQLPIQIGREIKRSGGTILLKEISTVDRLKKPEHVIGITSFEDAKEENESVFYSHLWSIVNYNSATVDWKTQLLTKIGYLVSLNKHII